MTILQLNRRAGHKFLFSGVLFGFSMARTTALVMRIAWASRPHNANIAIAANIFTVAGVVLLFIVNLIFAQRLLRATHPLFGWRRDVTGVFRALFVSVVACLIMLIVATVYSFFTLSANRRRICRDIQLVGTTYFTFLAFLPTPITILSLLWPHRPAVDKFGAGRFRSKVALLLFTSLLLTFGAGWRTGVAYDVRPISHPAWFHHKAAFYCVNFVIELIVVYTYVLARFDRRFHVPDGSSAPGHYAGLSEKVNREEEVFGSAAGPESADEERMVRLTSEWEEGARREVERDGEAVVV